MLKYQDADKALETLEQILKEPFTIIVRDATIQRFEYTFEALWKFTQEFLKDKEGVSVGSPKSVFRELLTIGILNDVDTVKFLEMTDKRNDTVHTYKEVIAQVIFSKIPQYGILMRDLLNKLKVRI